MTTELQRQVDRVRGQKNASLAQPVHRGRASIFLGPAEAAAVSYEAVQEAALSALMTLNQYDSRFGVYAENLLHPSSTTLQRELKTMEENEALDREIGSLLSLMSLFASEAAAHRVLEYLIQRYRVHELNSDELICSLLCIHDTKIFARVVQLCVIPPAASSVWSFMDGVKKSGFPLPRSVLVKMTQRNVAVLAALCKIVKSAVRLASANGVRAKSATAHGAEKVISFFTACLVELTQESALDDVQLRQLYPVLVEGLRSPAKASNENQSFSAEASLAIQWLKSSCMIVAQLGRKTKLAPPLLKSLTSVLSRAFVLGASSASASANLSSFESFGVIQATEGGSLEIAMTLAVLAQHHKVVYEGQCLHSLFFDAEPRKQGNGEGSGEIAPVFFLETLRSLPSVLLESSGLVNSLVSGLCDVLLVLDERSDIGESSSFVTSSASDILCSMISTGMLRENILRWTIEKLVLIGKDAQKVAQLSAARREDLFHVLRKIAQRFPNLFDGTVENLLRDKGTFGGGSDYKSSAAFKSLRKFLGSAFIDAQYHVPAADGGLSLLLSLRSTSPSVRIEALENFASTVPLVGDPTRDVVGLAEAALHCLLDQSATVALAAWNEAVLSRIAKYVEGALFAEAISTSISWWEEMSMRSAKLGCEILTKIFSSLGSGSGEGGALLVLLQNARDWTIYTVTSHALGLISHIIPSSPPDKAQHDELCKRVEAAAFKCVLSFQAHGVPLFLSISSGDVKADPQKAIAAAIAKYMTSPSTDSHLVHLRSLSERIKQSLRRGGSVVDKRMAQCFIRLIGSTVKLLSKSSSSAALNQALSIICPLLLKSIENSLGDSPECLASQAFATHVFTDIFDHVKSVRGTEFADDKSRRKSSVEAIMDDISAARSSPTSVDFRIQVLSGLLASPSPVIAPLVGMCLATFFPQQPLFILLELGLVGGSLSALDGDYSDVFTEAKVKAGALCVLSTMVGAHPLAGMSAQEHSSSMALLVLMTAASCCDEDASVRRGGLALATKMTKQQDGNAASLAALGKVLVASRASIEMDSLAASTLLSSEVFAKKNDKVLGELQKSLLSTLSIASWHVPETFAPVLLSASTMTLDSTAPFLAKITAESASTAGVSCSATAGLRLARAFVKCLSSVQSASATTQQEVAKLLCEVISSENTGEAQEALHEATLELLATGWAGAISSEEVRARIFKALVQEQVRMPGRVNIIKAIERTSVPSSIIVSMLQKVVGDFNTKFKNILDSQDEDQDPERMMAITDDDVPISGMSVELQKLCSLLEAIAQPIKSLSAATDKEFLASLAEINSAILDLFAFTNSRSLEAIYSVDYCKSILLDLAHACISKAGDSILQPEPPAAAKSSKANNKQAAPSSKKYSKARIPADIKAIMSCLSRSRSLQVQTSALSLLQVLVALDPSTVGACVKSLGELLASSTASLWKKGQEGLGKDEIVKKILRLVSFVASGPANGGVMLLQDVIQPLCVNMRAIPSSSRTGLLKMALSVFSDSALPICVGILLAHVFSSYNHEQSELAARTANNSDDSQSSFILLSRSAQRRALRAMKTSQPEEIFDLAVEISVTRPATSQVSNLVTIVHSIQQLLDISSAVPSASSLESIPVQFPGCLATCIDTKSLQSYLLQLMGNGNNATSDKADKCGAAAALTVLLLEYLFDVMENGIFHRALVQLMDVPESNFKIQEGFVQLSDHLLQLLAQATLLEQAAPSKFVLRLGQTSETLSTRSLGKCVSNWCLDILKSLQRLLDAPAFVSILQELVDHENPSVRQVALQILGQRLEKLNPKRTSSEEKVLLLDLSMHLRGTIQEALPKKGSAAVASANRGHTIGLAQSAIMCMDILATHFGKSKEWTVSLFDSLSLMVTFSSAIAGQTKQYASARNGGKSVVIPHANELKLLASSYLTCGTLVKVVGPKALPMLPTLMTNFLDIIETQSKIVLGKDGADADEATMVYDGEGGEEDEISNPALVLWRSRVLLLRSTLTAIGSVVEELHSFAHPYLEKILSATLALQDISRGSESDRAALVSDVDRCLTILASRISPRLSTPALLKAAPNLLASGHGIASRFAQLLGETYSSLTRAAVVAHLSDLCEIAALVLDYRRVFGDGSDASKAAESKGIEAVVALCLKLTETELKQLLGKLGEWRDSKVVAANKSRRGGARSRNVTFYRLLAALGAKLKAIFVPCAGPFWYFSLHLLLNFSTSAGKVTAESKSQKKRRLSDGKSTGKHDDGEDDDRAEENCQELECVAEAVLENIRIVCVHDEAEFVDEARYTATINTVGGLFATRGAFSSDDDYLLFTNDSVTPCLIALAQCAKRDTLWKPMVHNILMTARSHLGVVRLASVNALQNLFIKIGEEFLLLLPECLPFLSELLEDDNSEVTEVTAALVRYIEELSGESLDQWLV